MNRKPIDLQQATSWVIGIIGALALSSLVTKLASTYWNYASSHFGTRVAAGSAFAAILLLGIAAASLYGYIRVPVTRMLLYIRYMLLVAPIWSRERFSGGRPGNGRGNRRYTSEAEFMQEVPSRGVDEYDFGVVWREPGRPGLARVTWYSGTGELAVIWRYRDATDPIEVVGVLPTESSVRHALTDWPYACYSRNGIRWLRRRAAGLWSPLPAVGEYWRRRDLQPPPEPPPSPRPSVGQRIGLYHGFRDDDDPIVEIVQGPRSRPLHHYASHATGFEWGYGGSGPYDLARSILADRLGWPPAPVIIRQFKDDVIKPLNRGEFTLDFAVVDRWIIRHAKLFAKNPFAHID
jgi:hypothetical protein